MSVSARHAVAVWRRSAALYSRTWRYSLLPNFFEPVLYLAAIGIGVGAYIGEMGGMSYVAFLAPGLVAVAAMNGASFEVTYNAFVRLNFEKAYDGILTTPVQPEDVLAGELLWAVTRSTIYGGCFFLVIAAFGLAPLPGALLAIPVIPVCGLLFAAIGLSFSLRIQTIDLFSFYFTLFLTPLFLFSNIFFPLEERFSGVGLWIAEALPLVHPVRLIRAAFHGGGGAVSGWVLAWDALYVTVLSGLLIKLAAHAVRRRLLS